MPTQITVHTNWVQVGWWTPAEWSVYRVPESVGNWIEQHFSEMWIDVPEARSGAMKAYALSPELESWFLLRYS